jgi:hypothetical protein
MHNSVLFKGFFVCMKINEIIFICNSYVSIIRNSVTGPHSCAHRGLFCIRPDGKFSKFYRVRSQKS